MSAIIEARANFDRIAQQTTREFAERVVVEGRSVRSTCSAFSVSLTSILPLPAVYRLTLTSRANSLSGSAITFLSPRADECGMGRGAGVMRIGRVGKTNNRREFVLLNTGVEVLPVTNLVG